MIKFFRSVIRFTKFAVMFLIILNVLLTLAATLEPVRSEQKFDPADPNQMNFCDKSLTELCRGQNKKLTACKDVCKPNKEILEYIDDRPKFREAMVHEHNVLRNHLASGKEKNISFGTFSNINVLSYSLELEHIARCWLYNREWGPLGRHYHDSCSISPSQRKKVAQNLYFASDKNLYKKYEFELGYLRSLNNWYGEVKDMKNEIMDKFYADPHKYEGQVGHFTAMVWSSLTHVGCASGRPIDSKLPKAKKDKMFTSAVICDYTGEDQNANLLDEPVAERGKPCSKCSKGKKCNSKYKALCGEMEPTPQDPVKPMGEGSGAAPTGTGGTSGGTSGGANSTSQTSKFAPSVVVACLLPFLVLCKNF